VGTGAAGGASPPQQDYWGSKSYILFPHFFVLVQIFRATSHTLVSPEKLLKIVATRGENFSLKFTKYCLAAGIRQDPLGELKRSPNPLAAIKAYF